MLDLRCDADGVLWVTPPPGTSDLATMRSCRKQLVEEVDRRHADPRGERVRLLFDLRGCALGMAALQFTLRTLAKKEDYMRRTLERSAALLPGHNRAVKALADLFLRLYTPVRPFRIEVDEAAAHRFCAHRGGDDAGPHASTAFAAT